ncbi:unnamed protein product, partial [marine sediment metagenome]
KKPADHIISDGRQKIRPAGIPEGKEPQAQCIDYSPSSTAPGPRQEKKPAPVPPRAAGPYLTTQNSGGQVAKTPVRCTVCGTPCRSPWCPNCGWRTPKKILDFFEDFLAADDTPWVAFTLTADREKYLEGMDCYERWRTERAVGEFIRRARKAGIILESDAGRYFAFLEWQDGEWPHYHVCAQVTKAFYTELTDAFQKHRGRGIIEVNNTVIGPLWRHGFTRTTYEMDPVRLALYAAKYAAKQGKEKQAGLPDWYEEWREKTGHSRMTKWSFSQGFWSTLDLERIGGDDDVEQSDSREDPKMSHKPLRKERRKPLRRGARSTLAIVQGCGKETCNLFVECRCEVVDEGTGEVIKEGRCNELVGRINKPIGYVLERLRFEGIPLWDDGDKGKKCAFSLGDLRKATKIIGPRTGEWFNLAHVLALADGEPFEKGCGEW